MVVSLIAELVELSRVLRSDAIHSEYAPHQLSSVNCSSADAVTLEQCLLAKVLGLIAKEGWQKAHIGEYHSHKQALSKYTLSAILLSEPVLKMVRKQLRITAPGLKTDLQQIKKVIEWEVVKREILEGERAISAQRQVKRATRKSHRQRDMQDAPQEQASASLESEAPAAQLA